MASAEVSLAVQAFSDVLRVELLLARKREALQHAVSLLRSDEAVVEYMQITREMELESEEKFEKAGL